MLNHEHGSGESFYNTPAMIKHTYMFREASLSTIMCLAASGISKKCLSRRVKHALDVKGEG